MINSKRDCSESIARSITRTAGWRRGLQAKYPHDNRLGQAAEQLDRLADEATDLTDDQFAALQPFYSWNSEIWSDGVSKASRLVVFQKTVRSFPAYVENLVGILSEQQRAIH
jgi:hypothetical protein